MNENKIDVKFINDENINENAYLWRYMDIHKFLSFIFNKSLYFTRLDKFEDSKEGIKINHLFYLNLKRQLDNLQIFDNLRKYVSVDSLGGEMNKIDAELERIQKSNFANCWFIGENSYESVAMWNLYSEPNSLAIKIKYSDFKKLLTEKGLLCFDSTRKVLCSPINYIDFQKPDLKKIKNIDSVFTKDISFKHENEFRIIVKEKEREISEINYKPNLHRKKIEKLHNELWNYFGIELDFIDFDDFNFEIVHHPKSQDWAKKNIEEILNISDIKFKVNESILELK
ncbi:hypothetical protein J1D01_13395 [Seonamhaeicola sp. NFXS20]|uniref:hypothetical protein n=1 Tax=Seonamhaeicola sp. NFXS20 TaxID=2816959 RepID=UPI003B8BDDD9